jgi:hypothetical protein
MKKERENERMGGRKESCRSEYEERKEHLLQKVHTRHGNCDCTAHLINIHRMRKTPRQLRKALDSVWQGNFGSGEFIGRRVNWELPVWITCQSRMMG